LNAVRSHVLALVLIASSALTSAAQAQTPIPTRTPLAVIPIAPGKLVARVETTRVDFLPGQAMPAHRHTVPVICFISAGDFLVKIGDEPERRAPFGTTTYEPPGLTVHYFRNASATAPAQLQCASLAGAEDKVLNVMLDPEPRP
jgi:quercetin dioxygenase-like cupin family protein